MSPDTQKVAQSTEGQLGGENLAKLVAARYSLLADLQGNRVSVAELVDRTGSDRGNLSRYMKELEEGGLVESFDEPSEKLGRPKKSYKPTELCRKLLTPFIEASEHNALLEPDSEEVDQLLQIITKSSTPRAKNAAMSELIRLSTTTRLWKHRGFMELLDQVMKGEPTQQKTLNHLELVQMICRTSKRSGEDEIGLRLLKRYENRIAMIVEDSKQDRELRHRALMTFLALQEASKQGQLEVVRLAERLMKKERNDEQYNYLRPALSSSLSDFWKANRKGVRKWLFGLMQDPNEAVVNRAVQLHSDLSS